MMTEKERVHALLKEYGYYAKKSFGQNFLVNEGIIKRIVESVHPETFSTVIEIGPGLGALTLPLSQKAKKLIAVDADRDMIRILGDITKEKTNITLVQSDFLKFNPDKVSSAKDRLFIGNLPYNITSELFEYFLDKGFVTCGAMVQKEVFEKLDYQPGKKENTALGALIKATGDLSLVTLVDSSSFDPSPKVDSAFIKIEAKKRIPYTLYPIMKEIFKDPNKTIANCLRQYPKEAKALEFLKEREPETLALRARQLTAEDVVSLAKRIKKAS
jgi:16S rRNA (adenine1518-N6/adenine1519-N6)-dimethyltransferase